MLIQKTHFPFYKRHAILYQFSLHLVRSEENIAAEPATARDKSIQRSRNRFLEIRQYLYLCDNTYLLENDRFEKVRKYFQTFP